MSDYGMTYTMLELLLLCIFLHILSKTNKNIGTIAEIEWFRAIEIVYIIGIFSQILWGLQLSPTLSFSIPVIWGINAVYLICIGLGMYFWLRFIAEKMKNVQHRDVLVRMVKVQTVVVIVHVILILSSVFTKWIFYIDANGMYVRGGLFLLNTIATYSHWLCSIMMVLVGRNKEGKFVRSQLNRILLVSFIPAIGGLLQVINYRVPFGDGFVALSILFMFNIMQENHITTDALTQLNNRTHFKERYEKMIGKADAAPFGILIADIDGFKQINDTYGHTIGDQALLSIANGLRMIGDKYPGLGIYRYGGDEFVMLVPTSEVSDFDAFEQEVHQSINKAIQQDQLQFRITLSIGYERISNPMVDGMKALNEADKMLYQNKSKHKQEQ